MIMETLQRTALAGPGGAQPPTPPARRPADEPEGWAQALVPPLLGAVVGVAVLVGVGIALAGILIAFATSYLPVGVGLGQIGLYLLALVTASFYVRRWIGARAWRALHYLSFAVFMLALIHGVVSGADSGSLWAIAIYV